jgi:uncharacterized protein (DUF362 family)
MSSGRDRPNRGSSYRARRDPTGPARLDLLTRRGFLPRALGAALGAAAAGSLACQAGRSAPVTPVVVARAADYSAPLEQIVERGLRELGFDAAAVRGKRVLLKPNLVEPDPERRHVNTDPAVVRAVAAVLRRLGAARVVVGEGAGHRRDAYQVLDDSGMAEVLSQERLEFVDLNYEPPFSTPNQGGFGPLSHLHLPRLLQEIDWVVSLPKLKTHHWVGVTLAMKNLFGLMPGLVYGWPKNVLHIAGIESSILDICATVRPHLAIVDGVVGMEGDGPIHGEPRAVGALVMGTSLPAVDATAARVMGARPERVAYLQAAAPRLGPIEETAIEQRGESVASVRIAFELREDIPALARLR